MKRVVLVLGLVGLVSVCVGCTFPMGAVVAPVQMTQSPVAVGDTSMGADNLKVGKATVEGIILLAKGDASIETAMKNGGITRIHHVDSEEFNILGIYSTYTTIVYGK
jgi:hypothetical protein